MAAFTYTPGDPLAGTMDPEGVARGIPKTYVVKGMFFARLVSQLGSTFSDVLPRLEAPPRLGRYVPFTDYPQSDYVRVSAAAAQKVHPSLPLREALRRLGRDDFLVVAESTLGKVVLSAVGDVRGVLLKTPYMYEKMAPGDWTITGTELDASTVRIEWAPMYGTWEYQLGQVEGVVLNFGKSPRTTVSELPGRKVRFDVSYS